MNPTAERITQAAANLLAALTDDQRAVVSHPLNDDHERRRWFYTPNHRHGLPLTSLRPLQQQLVHKLLAAALSHTGYVTATTIMGLENPLDLQEHWSRPHDELGVEPAQRPRDPNRYYLTLFGDVGSDAWAWRYSGHHIVLHFAHLQGRIVSPTPTFFGANPADSPLGGANLLRPLAAEEDLGRELLHLLPDDRRARATLSPIAPDDITQSNRPTVTDDASPLPGWEMMGAPPQADLLAQYRAARGITTDVLDAVRYTTAPKGLPATEMNDAERDALTALAHLCIECVALGEHHSEAQVTRWLLEGNRRL